MTHKLKTFVFFTLLAIGLLAPSVKADVALFGISASYNNVFFGDYYARSGDIEGHAAIQGNIDVSGHSFGAGEQNLHQDRQWVLVVGGNAVVSSTSVFDGDAYIAGTLTPQPGQNKWNMLTAAGTGPYNSVDPGYQGEKGTVYVAGTPNTNLDPTYQQQTDWAIPFDFAQAKQELQIVSTMLSNLPNTATCEYVDPWSYMIDLTGKTGIQVVTIDAAIFNGLLNTQNIYIKADADTTLIINVTDDGNAGYLNLKKEFVINDVYVPFYNDNFDGSNILINTDIENVNVSGVALNASLLALNAHIDVQHGNIDGQAFGASAKATNGGEFHAYYVFDDKHFKDVTPKAVVPEPATLVILGLGAIGASFAARRRMKG
ncbi:MAG: choice-of-anchor A family protein [Planctomycetaceae bacterium]|nr:choice-of-anchor A family protein [Planctomycetaceae bacterium]